MIRFPRQTEGNLMLCKLRILYNLPKDLQSRLRYLLDWYFDLLHKCYEPTCCVNYFCFFDFHCQHLIRLLHMLYFLGWSNYSQIARVHFHDYLNFQGYHLIIRFALGWAHSEIFFICLTKRCWIFNVLCKKLQFYIA